MVLHICLHLSLWNPPLNHVSRKLPVRDAAKSPLGFPEQRRLLDHSARSDEDGLCFGQRHQVLLLPRLPQLRGPRGGRRGPKRAAAAASVAASCGGRRRWGRTRVTIPLLLRSRAACGCLRTPLPAGLGEVRLDWSLAPCTETWVTKKNQPRNGPP